DGAGKLAGLRGTINDTFDSWGSRAGLAAAAIGAIALAYDQASKFGNENGGWEGFKGFLGAGADPTKFGFEGIDAAMNEQARKEAAQRETTKFKPPETVQSAVAAAAYDRLGAPLAAPQLGAPGGYAAAFGIGGAAPGLAPSQVAPQVVVAGGQRGDEQARTNQQLQQAVKELPNQIAAALKGAVKIQLPPGAQGSVSGGSGVQVNQSGGY